MNNKMCKVMISKNTFIVDRIIFTKELPDLRNHKLRVYLLMCRVVGAQNGTFFMSISSIMAEVNITEHYVRDALLFLETNHFIKRVGKRGQANKYIVLSIPFYESATKIYVSNEAIPRTRSQQKNYQRGYCEMPIEVMQGSILRDKTKWTDRRIKVLGQLYMFHWIDMYGGVDPDVLYCQTNVLYVNDFITQMLGYCKKDVEKVVYWLIKNDYAYPVKVFYRINVNSCEGERQFIGDSGSVTAQPGDKEITVIRMTCVPEYKALNAIQRTGGLMTL